MSYKTIFGEEFENEFDEKMTHKYGDKYKCVKSVYPDVCKLPESEIQPMTYIARYQGDTVDEAKDLVRKYIKEKEPMWKQEYFNENSSFVDELKSSLNHNYDIKNLKNTLNPMAIGYGYGRGNQYAQNDIVNRTTDVQNPDYSLYGPGFTQKEIDQMLNDNRFQRAIKKTLKNEGGYVNHPKDPGGETNYGITKKWYPNEDIKNMTPERASAIYYRDYWTKPKINQLPDTFADIVFDNGVNQGASTAIKNLQKAIQVEDDGLIGPRTLEALDKSNDNIMDRFQKNVLSTYEKVAKKDAELKQYIKGWKNRAQSYYTDE